MVTTWLLGMKLSLVALKAYLQVGELLMGDVRYAVSVRGHSAYAVTVAGQEGLDVAIDRSARCCAARLLGLELIEVRRLRTR